MNISSIITSFLGYIISIESSRADSSRLSDVFIVRLAGGKSLLIAYSCRWLLGLIIWLVIVSSFMWKVMHDLRFLFLLYCLMVFVFH